MDETISGRELRFPPWFRQPIPDSSAVDHMARLLREGELHTVCEGARCPNLGRCWTKGTATFLILGETCTRRCRFCAVQSGTPEVVSDDEPWRVARAVKALKLGYVVITSVTRDDLPDKGAEQFAKTVRAIKTLMPETLVEVLIPDFSAREDCLRNVADAKPDVIGHNLETVRRLSTALRPQADHDRSLRVLSLVGEIAPEMMVKSGFMVGLGETDAEVLETLDELKASGCQIVTIGQYLAPTKGERHVPVARFVPPDMFETYRYEGMVRGLRSVVAGPLVRSSYLAEEAYQESLDSKERLAV